MRYVDSPHGPGTVVIVSGELTRYADFSMSMLRLRVPNGTQLDWARGVAIAGNLNAMLRRAVADPTRQWVWIMGDDHVFAPDLLLQLLDRSVEAVAPLCSFRSPPFHPHVYEDAPETTHFALSRWSDVHSGGLMPVDGCGSAGLLLRRDVLLQVGDPWFEVGKTAPDALGEDLWLCKKIRAAHIPIYVDCDHTLGHQTTVTLWPIGGQGVRVDMGRGFTMDLEIEGTFETIPTQASEV